MRTSPARPKALSLKDSVETIVIAKGGQKRCIGSQGLGVGRAATIPAKQQLSTGRKCFHYHVSRLGN
jgi:hypothetical protein